MSAWTVVEHKEITSQQKSITFNNIPQTGTDLIVFISSRGAADGANDGEFHLLLNSTNGSDRVLYDFGSGAPGTNTSSPMRFATSSSSTTASTFGNAFAYVPNYTGSASKNIIAESVAETNATGVAMYLTSGVISVGAVTSLTISGNRDLAALTSVTLYIITKGSSGGVTVS